jgi:23S rRNA (pseudouridine1915-N3)-methyltransferase
MKLRFVWVGKTKSRPIANMVADYLERTSHFGRVSVEEIRDAERMGKNVGQTFEREGRDILAKVSDDPFLVALDERGEQLSTREFAGFLEEQRQRGTKQITFVIGGYAGLSDEVWQSARKIVALSRMTLTHEMARLLLLEQVYRALTIINGVPYQK